ncbi:GNAT family N-acetyltransferase [Patulibacter minatonensis]|uniref:GNAT family N-acetyltransferase n=1 Tax=Patulibacter minatonensis TaxID=298163 RepID=UPI0004B83CB2|nr:GNAT family N-acetyltransferase [Patulibacter minatonensis]
MTGGTRPAPAAAGGRTAPPGADTAHVARIAGIAELPRLLQLVHAAYRGTASRAGWTTEADLLEGGRIDAGMLRELLVSLHDVVLRTGPHGTPGACCAVGRREDRVAFGMFAVAPSEQGRGTGRELLSAAERYAVQRWDATALHLSVIRQRTELIAWYERRGYVRTGETEPFPYGDERYGRPLRDDLELVVLRRALA